MSEVEEKTNDKEETFYKNTWYDQLIQYIPESIRSSGWY